MTTNKPTIRAEIEAILANLLSIKDDGFGNWHDIHQATDQILDLVDK